MFAYQKWINFILGTELGVGVTLAFKINDNSNEANSNSINSFIGSY